MGLVYQDVNGVLLPIEPPKQPTREEMEREDAAARSELRDSVQGYQPFLDQFEKLPEWAKREVMGLLKVMLMRRSGAGINLPGMGFGRRNTRLDCIAEIFEENGFEQEEYT